MPTKVKRRSTEDDDEETKKEKARQFSRDSRARKKEYIQSLENYVAQMKRQDQMKTAQIK